MFGGKEMSISETSSIFYPPKSYFLALICAGVGGFFYIIGLTPLTLLLFIVGGGIYLVGERIKSEEKKSFPKEDDGGNP